MRETTEEWTEPWKGREQTVTRNAELEEECIWRTTRQYRTDSSGEEVEMIEAVQEKRMKNSMSQGRWLSTGHPCSRWQRKRIYLACQQLPRNLNEERRNRQIRAKHHYRQSTRGLVSEAEVIRFGM